LSANSVMRGRLDARRTLKSLVADLRNKKNEPMKSTEEYLSILRSEKESLFRKYQISNLGLFGSVARHEQREDSDIDIYYESSHMSLFTLCRLKSELEKLLGCSVDLFCKRESFAGTRMEKSINKDLIYV
ncbi:nucleotidyltransferase family protein, partial [Parabacteroides distasonis]